MNYELSPCTYCCKVADPQNCDNKKCPAWQKWFMNRWEETRKLFRAPMDAATLQPVGIPLGGNRYPQPHRVSEDLENGPCKNCQIPRDLCELPCPALRAWQTKKEELYELESRSH